MRIIEERAFRAYLAMINAKTREEVQRYAALGLENFSILIEKGKWEDPVLDHFISKRMEINIKLWNMDEVFDDHFRRPIDHHTTFNRITLGGIQFLREKVDESLEIYSEHEAEIEGGDRQDQLTHRILYAKILFTRKRFEEGLDQLGKVRDLIPYEHTIDEKYYVTQSDALIGMNMHESAITQLEELAILYPDSPLIPQRMGHAFHLLGLTQVADDLYDKALKNGEGLCQYHISTTYLTSLLKLEVNYREMDVEVQPSIRNLFIRNGRISEKEVNFTLKYL